MTIKIDDFKTVLSFYRIFYNLKLKKKDFKNSFVKEKIEDEKGPYSYDNINKVEFYYEINESLKKVDSDFISMIKLDDITYSIIFKNRKLTNKRGVCVYTEICFELGSYLKNKEKYFTVYEIYFSEGEEVVDEVRTNKLDYDSFEFKEVLLKSIEYIVQKEKLKVLNLFKPIL